MWGGRWTLHEMLESPSHAGDAWQSSRRQQGQGKDPYGGSPPCCHAFTGSVTVLLAVNYVKSGHCHAFTPSPRPPLRRGRYKTPHFFCVLLPESQKMEESEAEDENHGGEVVESLGR